MIGQYPLLGTVFSISVVAYAAKTCARRQNQTPPVPTPSNPASLSQLPEELQKAKLDSYIEKIPKNKGAGIHLVSLYGELTDNLKNDITVIDKFINKIAVIGKNAGIHLVSLYEKLPKPLKEKKGVFDKFIDPTDNLKNDIIVIDKFINKIPVLHEKSGIHLVSLYEKLPKPLKEKKGVFDKFIDPTANCNNGLLYLIKLYNKLPKSLKEEEGEYDKFINKIAEPNSTDIHLLNLGLLYEKLPDKLKKDIAVIDKFINKIPVLHENAGTHLVSLYEKLPDKLKKDIAVIYKFINKIAKRNSADIHLVSLYEELPESLKEGVIDKFINPIVKSDDESDDEFDNSKYLGSLYAKFPITLQVDEGIIDKFIHNMTNSQDESADVSHNSKYLGLFFEELPGTLLEDQRVIDKFKKEFAKCSDHQGLMRFLYGLEPNIRDLYLNREAVETFETLKINLFSDLLTGQKRGGITHSISSRFYSDIFENFLKEYANKTYSDNLRKILEQFFKRDKEKYKDKSVDRTATTIFEQLNKKEKIFIPIFTEEHTIVVSFQYIEKKLKVSIFNSGHGLEHHKHKGSNKYQTEMPKYVRINDKEDAKQYIRGLLTSQEKDKINAIYEYIKAFKNDKGRDDLPYHASQKGDNCSLKSRLLAIGASLNKEQYLQLIIDLADWTLKKLEHLEDDDHRKEVTSELRKKIQKNKNKLETPRPETPPKRRKK